MGWSVEAEEPKLVIVAVPVMRALWVVMVPRSHVPEDDIASCCPNPPALAEKARSSVIIALLIEVVVVAKAI